MSCRFNMIEIVQKLNLKFKKSYYKSYDINQLYLIRHTN